MGEILAVLTMAAAIGAAGGGANPFHPVRLEVSNQGESSTIRVVAESPVACSASYALEVSGGAGSNKSVNRGTLTVQPSKKLTVVSVKLGGQTPDDVNARLIVTPSIGEPYQQVWP